MSTHVRRHHKHKAIVVNLITVLTILVQGTLGQSYLLTLGQNQRNFFTESSNSRETFLSVPLNYTDTAPNINPDTHEEFEDNNTTIIVIKSTVREETNELSQTAMDIITIVWYVATFLALAAFFLLMACSDRRCGDRHRNLGAQSGSDTPNPPPTPSPSYSEFAPPSYETVIKMQHAAKTSVFVIPFAENKESSNNNINTNSNSNTNSNNNTNNCGAHTPQTPTTPAINFYTVNELQKLGS